MGELADSPWVDRAARFGYVAKGVVYALIGLIAIQVPLNLEDAPKDRQGALRVVAQQPLGEVALLAIAAGLAGYALWRLSQAILDRDDEGEGAKGLAKRGGYLARGLLYGFFAFGAFALVAGIGSKSSDETEETARVFDLPLGRWLVFAAGLGFLGAGLFNGYRSLTADFRKHLHEHELGPNVREWVIVVGVVGHAARAVVFGLIGIFLCKAALQYDPEEAKGLDGALRTITEAPYGNAALFAVAAGLIAYAAFCFVQARYREV
jgi:uncharacterized protein DUF1206